MPAPSTVFWKEIPAYINSPSIAFVFFSKIISHTQKGPDICRVEI